MTFSKLVTGTSGNGGQYSARSQAVSMFVAHHAATMVEQNVLSLMRTGSRQVSSNYVIKDKSITGVVPEEFRSWSLSSALYDSKAITVETCNSAVGDASGWPISEESYASLAALVADCATRYGFPIDRDHVVGHREIYSRFGASYATACPGGIDLDRVVRDALAIQNKTTITVKPREGTMRIHTGLEFNGTAKLYLVTEAGHTHIMDPAHAALIQRHIDGATTFYRVELDIIGFYITRAATAATDPKWAELTKKIDDLSKLAATAPKK